MKKDVREPSEDRRPPMVTPSLGRGEVPYPILPPPVPRPGVTGGPREDLGEPVEPQRFGPKYDDGDARRGSRSVPSPGVPGAVYKMYVESARRPYYFCPGDRVAPGTASVRIRACRRHGRRPFTRGPG